MPQAFQFAYLAPGKLFGRRNLSRPRLKVALTAIQLRLPTRNFLQQPAVDNGSAFGRGRPSRRIGRRRRRLRSRLGGGV